MSEKLLIAISVCFFITTLVWANISHQKENDIVQLKTEKLELLKSLNNEKEEVIKAKKELIETREILGEIFMEAMEDREMFNQLKKKCKGSK